MMDKNRADLKIAESFNRTIEMSKAGINQYQTLPPFITEDPDYAIYLEKQIGAEHDSGRIQVKEYLCPHQGERFLDLGCCLNLIDRGYDSWNVQYYGVDISKRVIQELQEYIDRHRILVGGLYCCSMDSLPFEEGFFDCCACIGSLEYYTADYVEYVLSQVYRVLKPSGRFVLDIPNINVPEYRISQKIEAYLGRPDRFDLSEAAFDSIVQRWFLIEKKDKLGMIQYFLRRRNQMKCEGT